MEVVQIEKFFGNKFESKLYTAIRKNLSDIENPLRLNNFAYSMRELTRHILKRLAPDEKVILCPWYKNETEKENGISRKQRAYYAIQGGLSDDFVKNKLKIDVETVHRDLVKSIENLNKFTHIEEKTFDIPTEEVQPIVDYILGSIL